MIESARKLARPESKFCDPPETVSSPVFLAEWPEIALLVIERSKLKQPRSTPTVTFYFDAGKIGGCLNDRAQGLSMFVTGSDVQDVMRKLDRKLMSDNPDWREGRPWSRS